MASYVALQPHYNLMERAHYERELAPLCERHGLACIAYFALAQGFLTGKYRGDGEQVDSVRAAGVRERYFNERGFAVLDAARRDRRRARRCARGRGACLAARAADRARADRQRDLAASSSSS